MVFSVSESFFKDTECLKCPTQPPELDEMEIAVSQWGNNTISLGEWASKLYRPLPTREMPDLIQSLWKKARAGALKRLEPLDCINNYATSKLYSVKAA
jgi:uncharacterized tellurite resistance protein B-like protein